MNRLLLAALLFGLAGFAPADEPKGDKAKAAKALETFAGEWEIVTVTPDGATKDAQQLVFKTDGTYAAVDKAGKELWAGTFEIDPTANPKVWDSNQSRKLPESSFAVRGRRRIRRTRPTTRILRPRAGRPRRLLA